MLWHQSQELASPVRQELKELRGGAHGWVLRSKQSTLLLVLGSEGPLLWILR